jgi:hypothetical protein
MRQDAGVEESASKETAMATTRAAASTVAPAVEGQRMRSGARARILAALAVAGTAALLAACATAGPGQSTAPTSPSSGIEGAAPVPLDEAVLGTEGLFDRVADVGYAVGWLEVGQSIAVVIGGSGGGGECIPQPGPVATTGEPEQLEVAFAPPNPAVACTADFRLHGWELRLAETVDGEATQTVLLTNLRGEGESTEVALGPDDLLVQPGADPQPSMIPGEPADGAEAPTQIPSAQLPSAEALDRTQMPMVRVQWIEPGTSLAVMLGGSGTLPCVPGPVGATSTGTGTIEVAFALSTEPMDCSADLHVYGWAFTLAEPVSATLPVEVTVTGAEHDGRTATVTVQPEDVFQP